MAFKYRKLKGRIVEKYGTVKEFSNVLGCSVVTVSLRLNGHREFNTSEIKKWCDALDIDLGDIRSYFFD